MKRIEKALADLTPESLGRSTKIARMELRVTEEEKAEIQETAQRLGLTATEYLLSLHRHAAKHLRDT